MGKITNQMAMSLLKSVKACCCPARHQNGDGPGHESSTAANTEDKSEGNLNSAGGAGVTDQIASAGGVTNQVTSAGGSLSTAGLLKNQRRNEGAGPSQNKDERVAPPQTKNEGAGPSQNKGKGRASPERKIEGGGPGQGTEAGGVSSQRPGQRPSGLSSQGSTDGTGGRTTDGGQAEDAESDSELRTYTSGAKWVIPTF